MKIFKSRGKKERAILLSGVALIAAAISLYLAGLINQNITGEAYYDFHYADRFTLLPAIKVFFLNRVQSRFMHGAFIALLYEIIGFNPPLLHLSIFFLIIATAVMITLVLRQSIKHAWIAALFVVTLTVLPLNVPELATLKKAHHALAWFAFWTAVYFAQNWMATNKGRWLAAAGIAMMTSLLSYEAAAALLPIAVLLSLRFIESARDFAKKLLTMLSISLGSFLIFLWLESLKTSGRIRGLGSNNASAIGETAQALVAGFLQLAKGIWQDGLFSVFYTPDPAVSLAAKIIIAASLLLAVAGILWAFISSDQNSAKAGSAVHQPGFALLLSGLWLSFATYLPFLLVGQKPDGDSIRGAAFGLMLIALAATLWLESRWGRRLASGFIALVCVFWISIGAISYFSAMDLRADNDRLLNNFVYTLKEQVPYVKENTTFIYVNASLGRTGCIGMMNMLYSRDKLQCIHLKDSEAPDSYFREEGLLIEDSGREYEEDFIILTFDAQGYVTIIEEITQEGYPSLSLNWQSSAPILTNRSRILLVEVPGSRVSQFYEYMLARRIEMGWLDSR